jgi:cytochrome P450
VIYDMMDLPYSDRPEFIRLTGIAFQQADRPASHAAHEEMIEYGCGLARARRGNNQTDLVSRIANAEVDGTSLTDYEIGSFISLLIGAGAETTGSTISAALGVLHENPHELARWRNDYDALATTAVNELARWASPVINFRRTVTTDTVLGGQALKAGDKVVMYYESANNDEQVFVDPRKLDLSRKPNPHVTFGGGGIHQCLGMHLGLLELKQASQSSPTTACSICMKPYLAGFSASGTRLRCP